MVASSKNIILDGHFYISVVLSGIRLMKRIFINFRIEDNIKIPNMLPVILEDLAKEVIRN